MSHHPFTPAVSANPVQFARHARTRQGVGGFSLIEVLVSIVVLSFGLLGMVGMQAASLRANREARIQSSAAVLARELAEMIRGNRQIGALAVNNPYAGTFTNPSGTTPLVPATPKYCLGVGVAACADTTEIANAELTEWLARVDAELPGAKVSICFDSAPFDANGLPRWACTDSGGVLVLKIGWTKSSTNQALTGSNAFERATLPSIVLPVTV